MRKSDFSRKTKETDVLVKVKLDSRGEADVNTGISYLDQMLKTLATYSSINITVKATGDLYHHVIEDVALSVGECILKALNKHGGIHRFGFAIASANSSVAFAAIDLSKRPYVKINLKLKNDTIEDVSCEDVCHFFESFGMALRANLHLWLECGFDTKNNIKAALKALALSLRGAVSVDPRRVGSPSSKGAL